MKEAMRVKWTAYYKGGDPANCRRKLVRVLGIVAEDEKIEPWLDAAHLVTFFSRLESKSWDAAMVELLNTASIFNAGWSVLYGAGAHKHFSGTSTERKVANVESLRFELREEPNAETALA